jgi:uncharacterized protein (TIGR02147 family)
MTNIKIDIFEFDDYKAFLKGFITANNKTRGAKAFLAKAAGTERSYFSQVLNSKAHLTPDQAFQISLELKMTDREQEYWMLLVELGRTGTQTYKKFLQNKIKKIQSNNQDLKVRFNDPPRLAGDSEMAYFSKWYMVAIHLSCGIVLRDQVARISEILGLPKNLVLEAMLELKTLGLLIKVGEQWKPTQEVLYVHKSSPLCDIHHINWRQRAIFDVQKKTEASLHLTAVNSISKADFQKMKQMLLTFIKSGMDLSKNSKEECLACLNIDYFHFD